MSISLSVPIESDIIAPSGKIVGIMRSFIPEAYQADGIRIRGIWGVSKYDDQATYDAWLAGDPGALPYEIVKSHNIALNGGLHELWNLAAGISANLMNNTNSQIGIGDSATAAVATQTGLQASTNVYYQAVDSGFPTVSAQSFTFQAAIGPTSALYTWNEMVVKNNASGIVFNRVAQNQGTKSGSNVWTAQVVITSS